MRSCAYSASELGPITIHRTHYTSAPLFCRNCKRVGTKKKLIVLPMNTGKAKHISFGFRPARLAVWRAGASACLPSGASGRSATRRAPGLAASAVPSRRRRLGTAPALERDRTGAAGRRQTAAAAARGHRRPTNRDAQLPERHAGDAPDGAVRARVTVTGSCGRCHPGHCLHRVPRSMLSRSGWQRINVLLLFLHQTDLAL